MRGFLVFLLIALAAGSARAHDLWLEKDGGELRLQYGHKHSGHGGPTVLEYRVEWVRRGLCFDANGQIPSRPRRPTPSG
jgi:hypothetical protein